MMDLPYAAEIVREFHASLSKEDFTVRQIACRKLWEDHMIPEGFHWDFVKKIKNLLTK